MASDIQCEDLTYMEAFSKQHSGRTYNRGMDHHESGEGATPGVRERLHPGGAATPRHPSTWSRTSTRIGLAAIVALALSGCAPANGTPVSTSRATHAGQTLTAQQSELAKECVGSAETGTIKADVSSARVAQRPDGTWLVSVPMKFEALRYGEQHCVIADESGDLVRIAVESGEAWVDGEFEKWLESAELWYE